MKKAIVLTVFTLIACLSLTLTAYSAGKASNFYVSYVRVDRSGYGIVKFDQALIDTPASCISGHHHHLSFDTNTPGGKSIHALVLAAHLADKRIQARGTGTCDEYGVVESWNYGWVNE
jgi:hypothetical protein